MLSSGGRISNPCLETDINGGNWLGKKAVLFLDKGQTSYWGLELWQEFLEIIRLQTRESFVAGFASYDSPGGRCRA